MPENYTIIFILRTERNNLHVRYVSERCRRFPFESLTVKVISIPLELLKFFRVPWA